MEGDKSEKDLIKLNCEVVVKIKGDKLICEAWIGEEMIKGEETLIDSGISGFVSPELAIHTTLRALKNRLSDWFEQYYKNQFKSELKKEQAEDDPKWKPPNEEDKPT